MVLVGFRLRVHLPDQTERIVVVRVVQVFEQNLVIQGITAFVLNEVFRLEEVNSLVLQVLQKFLLLLFKKLITWHVVSVLLAAQAVGLRELLLDQLALGLCCGVRSETTATHEVQELAWHFCQSLFGKQHWIVLELAERHELNNVRIHVPAVLLGVERCLVSIQLVHRAEIGIAHTHDDDRERQAAAPYDLINRILHIVDNAIGNNQQNVILLVCLADIHTLSHVVDHFHNRPKVRRAIQIYTVDRVFVCLNDTVDTVALRVEDVAIQRKTVFSLLEVGRYLSAKAQYWDLLVRVVVLQDASHRSDRIQVLVFVHVEIVQRVWLRRMTIR